MGHLSPYKFEPVAAAAMGCHRKQPMTHEVNQSVADADHQQDAENLQDFG